MTLLFNPLAATGLLKAIRYVSRCANSLHMPFQGVQIRAQQIEGTAHIAANIASKQYRGTYNSAHEQCGFCGSTSPYCKVAVRWKRNYSDCRSGMAPLKPTLKRLVDWANALTECYVCHKYYWLLNTKDHYKNQHPGQQVPEVNEGTVQRLLKKLMKDQTTKNVLLGE